MFVEEKPKKRVSDNLQIEMDFLRTDEAIKLIDETAREAGYPDSDLMLADQGSNGAGDHEVYVHQTINKDKARKRLEKNIRRNGGDGGWITGHQ